MSKSSVFTAIAAVLGLVVLGTVLTQPAMAAARGAGATKLPDGLSQSDWAGIRKARMVERHRIAPLAGRAGVWHARNPGQAWRSYFDGRGFRVEPDAGGWSWGLELSRIGIGDDRHEVGGAAPVTAGATRVSYAWSAGLEEWFVNDTRGLEHGFTLRERPGSRPGPLILELAVRGGLQPVAQPSGRSVSFIDARGNAVVTYGGLTVFDADGRELPARMEVADTALKVVVADQGARYPVTIDPVAQQAYLKASNTDADDRFGFSVAVSGDTAVVGAILEDSCATGVDEDGSDNGCANSGAAYVFLRTDGVWAQQAYLKASNTSVDASGDRFGFPVAVSGDTVVVGAFAEDSCSSGVNGTEDDNGCSGAGAAYVFLRADGVWAQQAYLKASNTEDLDLFGTSVAVSGDTVVVSARREGSCATGVDGNEDDNSCSGTSNIQGAGAAYVFQRTGSVWAQQAYLKASNTDNNDDQFGHSVAVSGDTVVVAAFQEDSCDIGVNGDESNNGCPGAGAAYVFLRADGVWAQQAYLKASNTDNTFARFGRAVAISGDTVVVSANEEPSCATGVNGDETDNACAFAGAAYVFQRTGGVWAQQAYLKASNTNVDDQFGWSVGVSGDTVVVGASTEDSCDTGIDGDEIDNGCDRAGAAYVFLRSDGVWTQQAYLKASNTSAIDLFGTSVAVSGDTALVSADHEASCASGVDGDEDDNNCDSAGAAYVFDLLDLRLLDLIEDLIDTVIDLSLNRGVENSLVNKLDAAFDGVTDGDDSIVITNLDSFIAAVEKFRGKKIPPSDADALTALAQDILALLVFQPTGTVVGNVTDSTGNPIEGATVSDDSGQDAATDSFGDYTLSDVPAGTRTVTASAASFTTQQNTGVAVLDGQTASEVDFALDLEPAGGGTGRIKGTVTDAGTGAKLGGVSVTADTGETATTNKGGKYMVRNVPAGNRTMTASIGGYVTQQQPATVAAGQPTTVNFALE